MPYKRQYLKDYAIDLIFVSFWHEMRILHHTLSPLTKKQVRSPLPSFSKFSIQILKIEK